MCLYNFKKSPKIIIDIKNDTNDIIDYVIKLFVLFY